MEEVTYIIIHKALLHNFRVPNASQRSRKNAVRSWIRWIMQL